MADPLRKPLEPDFNVESFSEPALPENATSVPEMEPRDRKLVNAAENVGTTLGSAVGTIREKVQSGLEIVKKRSAEKSATVGDLTGKVRERADEVKQETNRRIQQWRRTAAQKVGILRSRARDFARERPAELILSIGAVAIIGGIILRLWRSNRD